jgi:CheY-like chemotaxis protein
MKLVLVVEDEYGSAEVLQLLLEAEGYRVAVANNGQAALDLLAGEVPALILTDFMMPAMNGAEFGNAVRANPALAHIPIVVISATSEEVVQRAFRDYDAFLTKPYAIDSLLPLMARLIAVGRTAQPSSAEVEESMRQLLKGIELPPGA